MPDFASSKTSQGRPCFHSSLNFPDVNRCYANMFWTSSFLIGRISLFVWFGRFVLLFFIGRRGGRNIGIVVHYNVASSYVNGHIPMQSNRRTLFGKNLSHWVLSGGLLQTMGVGSPGKAAAAEDTRCLSGEQRDGQYSMGDRREGADPFGSPAYCQYVARVPPSMSSKVAADYVDSAHPYRRRRAWFLCYGEGQDQITVAAGAAESRPSLEGVYRRTTPPRVPVSPCSREVAASAQIQEIRPGNVQENLQLTQRTASFPLFPDVYCM